MMDDRRVVLVDGVTVPDALNEALIRTVVHRFYDAIRADPMLGPVFGAKIVEDRWPVHLARMCDFWSSSLLRSGRYDGRPLPPHLRIDGLGEAHFRRWLELFKATLEEVCPASVRPLFMVRALRMANSFRLAIAFHRGEDTVSLKPIGDEYFEKA